ncbi:hypothetical protein KW850_08455 [Bacillus sp. sid0103]|uniref:hypothetical protein n=1 Tax=Bacillaceae TaxID=186817 RepID=UPI001C480A8D|nr:hypothetical protein [Bacillus sp. sid0103]MBV7505283.1 hypothetical protein [Bacillus sp. sid0103]
MIFRVRIFDQKGQELEIENKVIGGILFESEEAIEFFINAIRSSLPPNFLYKVIPENQADVH